MLWCFNFTFCTVLFNFPSPWCSWSKKWSLADLISNISTSIFYPASQKYGCRFQHYAIQIFRFPFGVEHFLFMLDFRFVWWLLVNTYMAIINPATYIFFIFYSVAIMLLSSYWKDVVKLYIMVSTSQIVTCFKFIILSQSHIIKVCKELVGQSETKINND